jgi:hypothetical protein
LDCGEVTLEFTARAILNEAFKTPEIIKLFMSKRSDGLRQKLQEITRDNTIGKLGTFSLKLKVSKFQKKILLFSFPLKKKRNYFLIPALGSKMGHTKNKCLKYI